MQWAMRKSLIMLLYFDISLKHVGIIFNIIVKLLCSYMYKLSQSTLQCTVRVLILAQPNFSGNGWK